MTITLSINGAKVELDCRPHESLRTVLRRAGYHSVRFGSETGETGAAAVLVDGALITSDLMLAAQADGHEIETVEGLSSPGHLHPIQEAFIETGAIQSGYSTPAMILAAKALIDRRPNPTEDDVRDALSGILDRETGYLRPVHAVLRAAAVMRGEAPESVDTVFLDPIADVDGAGTPQSDLPAIAPRVVPSADVPETPETVTLDPDRRARLVAFVEASSSMPNEVKARLLNQLKAESVPARVVQRIESRMGG